MAADRGSGKLSEAKRAKPVIAYALKSGGVIDITSIDDDRASLIRTLNRPAGQSVIMVRISEVASPPAREKGKK